MCEPWQTQICFTFKPPCRNNSDNVQVLDNGGHRIYREHEGEARVKSPYVHEEEVRGVPMRACHHDNLGQHQYQLLQCKKKYLRVH